MSTSLIRPTRLRLPLRTTAISIRHYAAPHSDQGGDPKREVIRRVLFPSNIRNRATPIGTWRPDVGRAIQRAIPSVQAHETIERACLLHKRHARKKREEETARKFACMQKAMDVLHDIDPRLYMEANKKDDPRARSQDEMEMMKKMKVSEIRALEARIRGLFPRELRIPTETPSRTGWKYEWKSFHRPL
ncbi:hypothetical protein NLJ89_g3476 [Agrocybe chaxingu]|uniref:Uncharacterized protein n=1 Tax=Agrocybe chaxingu TaxID=84603 RepID=A0A9W8K3X4_9AGAR|nr:hypothetical protein NLJ89_g3476 [Agrocybe chaxingu]